jgi:hypothetical protein
MELSLGSHVLEHGNRVGRLAGFELEPAERRIRRIIFSSDGELGPHAMTRPVTAIAGLRGSAIELAGQTPGQALPAVPDVVLLSRATRVVDGANQQARLAAVSVDRETRALLSVSGRRHWWTGRTTVPAGELDCSTPGQLRQTKSHDTRAA